MLSDFGVSSVFAASQVISDTTTIKGSARWMAIEFYTQLSSGMIAQANEKTDVWAFGMTVYVGADLYPSG
jgi:serine/threonine protein kinase